jgi:hypothetical protein
MLHHVAFTLGLLCIIAPMQGQGAERLTEDNIRAFIEKTSLITTGKETGMSGEDIDAYLNAHIHPQARFKSTIRFTIPGFEPQETKLALNKEGFISNVRKVATSVQDFESRVGISNIMIAGNGRRATLQTRSMESVTMPVADQNGTEDVPMEGISICAQTLVLTDDIIQMYGADCTTEIEFQAFDP